RRRPAGGVSRRWRAASSDPDGRLLQDLPYEVLFLHAGVLGLGVEREAVREGVDRLGLHVLGDGVGAGVAEGAGLDDAEEAEHAARGAAHLEGGMLPRRVGQADEVL